MSFGRLTFVDDQVSYRPRRQRQCQQREAGQAPRGVRGGHERDATDDPIRQVRSEADREGIGRRRAARLAGLN